MARVNKGFLSKETAKGFAQGVLYVNDSRISVPGVNFVNGRWWVTLEDEDIKEDFSDELFSKEETGKD